jgi:hypothetical protein
LLARTRRGLRRGGATALVLLTLIGSALPARVAAFDTASVPDVGDRFADVLPAALAPAAAAAQSLSAYRMDVMLDPAVSTIGGEMTLAWRNAAAEPLAEVWFRLFPNAGYYGEGSLMVGDVTVDGETVDRELALDDTALRVPLPHAVAPGGSAEIALTFTTTVPADSTGSYGIFTRDTADGSWVLADWYPILAVYEEESGWALPPVTSFGDPTYAPSAFYDVRLTAPEGLQVVATGVVTEGSAGGGLVTRHVVAGPSRDFTIVADDDDVAQSLDVDGTRVRLWTAPELGPAAREETLTVAADALRYYNETFGPYPARELDLVQTDPAGALGIAWAGLIFLDGPGLLGTYAGHDPEGLATIVAHEVSHLWWGILVGGDSNAHGYMQESLATVSAILFVAETMGPDAAREALEAWVIRPARSLLKAGDAVVDLPMADGQDEGIRSAATYGKGSLGFLAIRQEIGDAAFRAALRDVSDRYSWGEMTPPQLRAAFEAASGKNLSALWRHWFDETAMTAEEIDAIAETFG